MHRLTLWLQVIRLTLIQRPESDISSSGIFFIGTENARLLTSDCVAPTSINLIDLEPRWSPADPGPPRRLGEVDQSSAGGQCCSLRPTVYSTTLIPRYGSEKAYSSYSLLKTWVPFCSSARLALCKLLQRGMVWCFSRLTWIIFSFDFRWEND